MAIVDYLQISSFFFAYRSIRFFRSGSEYKPSDSDCEAFHVPVKVRKTVDDKFCNICQEKLQNPPCCSSFNGVSTQVEENISSGNSNINNCTSVVDSESQGDGNESSVNIL